MHGWLVPLLITVSVCGQCEGTDALVADLERESAEYLIVQNERIVAPDGNLYWAGGSVSGFRIAFSEGYFHSMTINNDSRNFNGTRGRLLGLCFAVEAAELPNDKWRKVLHRTVRCTS
jgi:hypothetical protein